MSVAPQESGESSRTCPPDKRTLQDLRPISSISRIPVNFTACASTKGSNEFSPVKTSGSLANGLISSGFAWIVSRFLVFLDVVSIFVFTSIDTDESEPVASAADPSLSRRRFANALILAVTVSTNSSTSSYTRTIWHAEINQEWKKSFIGWWISRSE